MPIAVSCPECGKVYQLPEESLGRKANCKSCGNAFRVQTGIEVPQANRSVGDGVSGSKSRISSSDTLPAQIGRFQILDKLGAGAFGTVYKAYDPVLEREVAVKVPNPGLLSSERDKQRYLREPKAAGQLHHPNIVPVFEASLDGDNIFIVSAFIKGRTLEKAIEEKRPDLRRAATLVMKLARALQYAHENGIVHRDVKPANIMLDAKGEPLLMDFGLARIQESAEKLTMNEAVLGTPAYMSPEQAAHNNESVGPASDQYSLGVILFEMLCGQRPFSGPAAIVMSLVMKQEPPVPRSLNPKLPRDLETICLKAMAKEPKKRFADCQELADDLERWLQDEPINARRTTILERGIRWCRRNPLVAGLTSSVGALLVAVVVISTLSAYRLRGEIRKAFRNNYFAQMNLAQVDWENADLGRLNDRLAQTLPEKTGDIDLRGFEWHYWKRKINGQLSTISKPEEKILGAVFSPDGKWIATCGTSLRVWNSSTTDEAWCVTTKPGFSAVAYSADGKWIATGNNQGTTEIWDAKTGAPSFALKTHPLFVSHISFSPDSRQILSVGFSAPAIITDVTSRKIISTIPGSTNPVRREALYFPNGRNVLMVEGATITNHDATTGDNNQIIKIPSLVLCAAITSDGTRFALGRYDGRTNIIDSTSGDIVGSLIGHKGNILSVAFSPRDTRIVTASNVNTIRIWDAVTFQEITKIRAHNTYVKSALFNHDASRLLSVGDDHKAKLWDTTDSQKTNTFTPQVNRPRWFYRYRFNSDGNAVLAITSDPNGAGTSAHVAEIGGSLKNVACRTVVASVKHEIIKDDKIAILGDGKRIALISDGNIKILITSTQKEEVTFNGHNSRCCGFASSPDGRFIASADIENGGSVFMWDTSTGREIFKLKSIATSTDKGIGLLFSMDGTKLLTFLRGGVWGWDAKTGKRLGSLVPFPFGSNRGVLPCISISADGNWIAFGFTGGDIMVWSWRTGQLCVVRTGCEDEKMCFAISPDGARVASTGTRFTITIWDSATGRDCITFNEHTTEITGIAFTADGARILSGDIDGTIKVWDATDKE